MKFFKCNYCNLLYCKEITGEDKVKLLKGVSVSDIEVESQICSNCESKIYQLGIYKLNNLNHIVALYK